MKRWYPNEITAQNGAVLTTRYIAETHYDAIVAENIKLRDKLLECAKECSECNGTGITTTYSQTANELIQNIVDCPDCADIREVLR